MWEREWKTLVHWVENHKLSVTEQNGLFIAGMGLAGVFGTAQYVFMRQLRENG
jgi:hypothetical protein